MYSSYSQGCPNSRILDLPLLHARSKDEKEKVVEGLVAINSVIPGIESYIHGHTPHNENPVKNYSEEKLDVTVVNCDVDYSNLPFIEA